MLTNFVVTIGRLHRRGAEDREKTRSLTEALVGPLRLLPVLCASAVNQFSEKEKNITR
jgi:hypothetical protein